ncbi:MAG: hypothetical protein IKK47_03510 [Ruminococcus sp.]|nr:hypothetical protein [Ruminococcus sp.]
MNNHLTTSNANNKYLIEYISEFLIDLGIDPELKGFNYIGEAAVMFPDIIRSNKSVKDLYRIIGEIYDTSPKRVERLIRMSLEAAWYSDKINLSNKIFDSQYFNEQNIPSNARFIAAVSEIIRMKFICI